MILTHWLAFSILISFIFKTEELRKSPENVVQHPKCSFMLYTSTVFLVATFTEIVAPFCCTDRISKPSATKAVLPVCHHSSHTSSFMPVSNSIMTQASMGRAISRLLLFRCSSRAVPNAGFSVQESGNGTSISKVLL